MHSCRGSNLPQLRAWDGAEGEYWADDAEHFDRSVAGYHQRLLEMAEKGLIVAVTLTLELID